ncbi:unnamed protein product [Paramecium octaurelia]|uniref:Uncharacterized protein n=1 Tax=Paramecium octaurelia TaxID=43137 RepID=A0A8S1WP93_PAROT|nr:unnamed protein product [Paramecium octaurelia]
MTLIDIPKVILKEKLNIQFFKFLVGFTSIDNRFIQCETTSLNIVEMKVDLKNQKILKNDRKNTSLIGQIQFWCGLSGSLFENLNISGMIYGAQLFYCKWKTQRQNYINQMDIGKTQFVLLFFKWQLLRCMWLRLNHLILKENLYFQEIKWLNCLSSGKFFCLWNCKTRKRKSRLDGHSYNFITVCFSSDCMGLASGRFDKSICIWDIRTREQQAYLGGHTNRVMSVCFHLMVLCQPLVVIIKLLGYGKLRMDDKKSYSKQFLVLLQLF